MTRKPLHTPKEMSVPADAPAATAGPALGLAAAPAHAITTPAWRAAHASLIFVWLWTAFVSLWEFHGKSQELLAALAPYPAWVMQGLILSGAAVDLLIGLWLWLRPGRTAYATAGVVMGLMTLLATALQPELWLHPLGPLSKNLPIAALLFVLWQSARPTRSNVPAPAPASKRTGSAAGTPADESAV